jgi:hypothetical protein
MKWSALLAVICVSFNSSGIALAQDIWIRAQGVDRTDRKENFPAFYRDSSAFLKQCADSAVHPDCAFFGDTTPTYASDPDQVKALQLPVEPPATRQAVLTLFQSKLASAKSGTTIVLNLDGHGSPSKTANSCIYLSDQDKICDTDLAAILKSKPPGVRVYIDAEGCFSGAFVDLAGPEVCVSVGADRRSAGFSGDGFLWSKVRNSNAKTLSDLESATEKNLLLASSQIKSMMCRKVRDVAFARWAPDANGFMDDNEPEPTWKKPYENELFFSRQSCIDSSESDSYKQLYAMARGYQKFLNDSAAFSCEKVGFTGDLCSALQIVLSRSFSNEIKELSGIAGQLAHPSARDQEHQERLRQKFNSRLATLMSGRYFAAWKKIEPCLFDVEREISTEEKKYFNSKRGDLPLFPRDYTQKDVEEAQSCEASVRFR